MSTTTSAIRTVRAFGRTHTYRAVASVPAGMRWDTPQREQGQIVSLSYAGAGRSEADAGDTWMRITDASAGTTSYYRLAWSLTIEGEGDQPESLSGDEDERSAVAWAERLIRKGDYDLADGETTTVRYHLRRGEVQVDRHVEIEG